MRKQFVLLYNTTRDWLEEAQVPITFFSLIAMFTNINMIG